MAKGSDMDEPEERHNYLSPRGKISIGDLDGSTDG